MSTSPTTVYTSIYFNCANGPFANEKFRQAIDYAIDEKAVVEAVHQGTATYTPYPSMPALRSWNPDMMSRRQNSFWKKVV